MNSVLSVYAICVVVLLLKMLTISCYQGYFRLRSQIFTNPEDAAVFRRSAEFEECPQVRRGAKAWSNDLESIPLFIALGGLAVAVDAPGVMSQYLSGLFTVARVLHTVTYLAGVQPWRTVSYGMGVLCLLGLAGMIVLKVLAA